MDKKKMIEERIKELESIKVKNVSIYEDILRPLGINIDEVNWFGTAGFFLKSNGWKKVVNKRILSYDFVGKNK